MRKQVKLDRGFRNLPAGYIILGILLAGALFFLVGMPQYLIDLANDSPNPVPRKVLINK